MALIWSPYTFSIIIFILNLISFCIFCIFDVLEKKRAKEVLYGLMCAFNLALIVAGCDGLRRTKS